MTAFQNVLAIDTALNGCSVGLYISEKEVRASARLETQRGQAEHLVPEIQGLLGENKLGFDGLDAILVTNGPGAFAGLRIGLSTARAFSAALEIPVFGLTTFQAMALTYQDKQPLKEPFSVILETKRQDFYAQLFDQTLAPQSDPMATNAEDIAERMLSKHDYHTIVGNALARFQGLSAKNLHAHDITLTDMGLCAMCFSKGLYPSFFSENPKPLYLRGADVSLSNKPQRKMSSS